MWRYLPKILFFTCMAHVALFLWQISFASVIPLDFANQDFAAHYHRFVYEKIIFSILIANVVFFSKWGRRHGVALASTGAIFSFFYTCFVFVHLFDSSTETWRTAEILYRNINNRTARIEIQEAPALMYAEHRKVKLVPRWYFWNYVTIINEQMPIDTSVWKPLNSPQKISSEPLLSGENESPTLVRVLCGSWRS